MSTPAKDQAFRKIADLVLRFEEQLPSYKKAEYNETLTRHDFIDPFFMALGWDVNNEQGYAEPYREVIHEDKIKISGSTKAPDYCFRLPGGKRLFFVEAKKPGVAVKDDILPAYQIRRYGWSAKMPISIITDFEEFAIYDCTKKPNPADKASTARIQYIYFTDYVKEFDFIWNTFSKESVLKGAFDKFVGGEKGKKGTSGVDKEFLQSLDEWRKYLATNISWNNKGLNEEEVNYVVQQTIDRIIFLRIAEDRSVEPYGNLKHVIRQGDFYNNLFDCFRHADEKYNSGLFDFKKDTLSPTVHVDNKIIRSIVQELYYPECPYEFSVLPVEILGNAYEQFLGKVIRLTPAHIAKIEEKPEVRKAGGVYYTPQYIVDYIVKNTLGKLLEGQTPQTAEKLRIVDPACGSGSFLLGAYQYLLDWHLDYFSIHGTRRSRGLKEDVLTPDGHLTTQIKKRILLNNIYGVDIDPQAVEVTKLSLLLKCLEGETEASIKQQFSLWNERVLPTLENNIKCGNSLIDMDFYEGKLDFGDERKVRPFSWQQAFPEVFEQEGTPAEASAKVGFDAVIGNPPYVRQELLGEHKPYFATHFRVYHGVADLYSYFIEKGISLLNTKGLFGFIVANKWMRANYGEPLRRWLKQQQIKQIIDFGDLPVFTEATTYPCILICGKQDEHMEFEAVNVKTLGFDNLEEYVESNKLILTRELLDDRGWNLVSDKEINLLKKIQSRGIPLGEYVTGKIYYGIKTGLNEAFVIDRETRDRMIGEDPRSAEIIKPFLAGRDIKRYQKPQSDKYLIFTKRGIDIRLYPAIKQHLLKFKENLLPKPDQWKGEKWKGRAPGNYKWFELQASPEDNERFEQPKIMYPDIALSAQAILDDQGFYSVNTVYMVVTHDKWLLGFINSSVFHFIFSRLTNSIRGGYLRFFSQYMERVTIPIINDRSKKEIEILVINMISLNEELQLEKLPDKLDQLKSRIQYTDQRINELVYKLYGLTEEEVKIVEGKY
jgi:type I restriction-modification system DNA methylase subunit